MKFLTNYITKSVGFNFNLSCEGEGKYKFNKYNTRFLNGPIKKVKEFF